MTDNDRSDPALLAHVPEIVSSSPSHRVVTQQNILAQQNLSRDTPGDGTSDEVKVDFSRYFHSLRRNWLLGMTLGVIAAVPLVILTWKALPPQYTATQLVRISATQTSIVNFGTHESVGPGEFRSFKNTQKQLVIQPFALSTALKSEEVAKLASVANQADPIKWLQKRIRIEFPDEAEIMVISLSSADPLEAYAIVKAVVDTYKNDVVDKERHEREQRVDTLERILRETEERVRKKRNELTSLVTSLGMSDKSTVDLSQQKTLEQFGEVRSQLGKTKFEIMNLQNELDLQRILNGPEDSQIATVKYEEGESKTEAAQGQTPAVNAAQLNSTEREGAGGDSTARKKFKDPKFEEILETDIIAVQLNKDIERLQNLIKNTHKKYDAIRAEQFVAQYQQKLEEAQLKLEDRTKNLQLRFPSETAGISPAELITTKIGIFKKQEELLRQEMEELLAESKKFGKSSIDVELLRKEIDALEPMVSKINQQIEQTKIELQSASRVELLPSNGVPTTGDNKKRLPMTAFAGLAGLFGPLMLLVLRDFSKNHVNDIAAINDNAKISVLGSIPHVPAKFMKLLNDQKHVRAAQWRERIAESVAAVTAMLLRKLATEGHRVIMVASATSGEGKSTLAELLARSLAASGHKTLLIDFDFRKPELHRRFNIPLAPGASEVLRTDTDLKQAVRVTNSPNLSVLTAGESSGSLLLEAANGTLDNLFKECRAEYELVVVDSSPLLPVVDGRLVGQFTDGAIMSIFKDSSQISRVLAARDIMCDFGIPILGCVLSGDNPNGQYYGYGTSSSIPGAMARGITASRSMSAM